MNGRGKRSKKICSKKKQILRRNEKSKGVIQASSFVFWYELFPTFLEWYKKFPTFETRDLFLTGESMQIGNSLLLLDRDVPATYEFFWSHRMISDEVGLAIMSD